MGNIAQNWEDRTNNGEHSQHDLFMQKCSIEEIQAVAFFDEIKTNLTKQHIPHCIRNKSRLMSVDVPDAYLSTIAMANFRLWLDSNRLMTGLGHSEQATVLIIAPRI